MAGSDYRLAIPSSTKDKNIKKIVIAGYYGFGNVGDELILSAILAQVREKYPQGQITVLSANPEKTSSQSKVLSINRWKPLEVVKALWDADLFILGGGGLFQNQTSNRSLLYYLGLVVMSRLIGCPVLCYAVGVEELKGRIWKNLMAMVLEHPSVKITVRDYHSRDSLRGMSITPSAIHVTADPVFSQPLNGVPKSRYAFNSSSALLVPRFPCPPAGWQVYSNIVDVLKEENWEVKGLLFQPSIEAQQLSNGHKTISPDFKFITAMTLEEIPSVFNSFQCVISARFHGLVLAAMHGKSFIGVGSPEKVGRICEMLDMPYIPWNMDYAQIKGILRQFLVNQPPVTPKNVEALKRASLKTKELLV